jgi:hypothetical protein
MIRNFVIFGASGDLGYGRLLLNVLKGDLTLSSIGS